jgi:hypothetical protein
MAHVRQGARARLGSAVCVGLGVCLGSSLGPGCSGGGGSGASSSPSAPTVLHAEPGDQSIRLRWDEVAGADGYTLYWSAAATVNTHSGTPITGVSTPFDHIGLTNGQVYSYVVVAVNALGQGEASPMVSAKPGLPSYEHAPLWSMAEPLQLLQLDWDAGLSAVQNGAILKATVSGLQPGQRLELGSGTWSVDSFFSIDLAGTPAAPIWIAAKPGATPVITRPNTSQNALNVGANTQARYLVLEQLEITGGDTALKIFKATQLWIDQCHIHDCGGAGIAANTYDTSFLHLTRNHVHHTAGTAEGMYLGANDGVVAMSHSVIADNHIHDTFGDQGDGIELKQGSFANRIVGNEVHDTKYPCITVYGTAGLAPNVIERNVCYRSQDNVMQVQGEAIVRDNLIVGGSQGFQSHDHQGMTMNLEVVHNTIVSQNRGANLADWNNRPGMVFANNVVYSQTSQAVVFGSGSGGVALAGNVALGPVVGAATGFTAGVGLSDFTNLAWDGSALDATPTPGGALIGMADGLWLVEVDLNGAELAAPFEPGCVDGP